MRNLIEKTIFITFALFTALTGLMWIFMPDRLAAAIAGAASAHAIDIGRARGATDFAIAIIAWNSRHPVASVGRQQILLVLMVANALMMIPGTIAQLQTIATPSRWIVYFAHVGWAIGFAYLYFRGRYQTGVRFK